MITLITGTPGSGKSLYAVKRIKDALSEGRQVYSDIEGLTLEVADKSPDDWRDTPEGSLIVYDEAQVRFPSSGRAGAANVSDVIRALETHRHTGHDIVYITQHPTFIDSHLRKLVGEHVHVRRPANAKFATLAISNEVMPDPQKPGDHVLRESFPYPKELFDCYKSATVHTHKVRIPLVFKVVGVSLVLLFGFAFYKFQTSDFFGGSGDPVPVSVSEEVESPSPTPVLVPPDVAAFRGPDPGPRNRLLFSSLSASELPVVSSCQYVGIYCSCKDSDGNYLALDDRSCRFVSKHAPLKNPEVPTNEKDDAVSVRRGAPAERSRG